MHWGFAQIKTQGGRGAGRTGWEPVASFLGAQAVLGCLNWVELG
jgi:hypothetical protein